MGACIRNLSRLNNSQSWSPTPKKLAQQSWLTNWNQNFWISSQSIKTCIIDSDLDPHLEHWSESIMCLFFMYSFVVSTRLLVICSKLLTIASQISEDLETILTIGITTDPQLYFALMMRSHKELGSLIMVHPSFMQ